MPAYPWWWHASVGVGIVMTGIIGDLFESMLKRAADMKDSGAIIPGHGGVLDRIDALLFAARKLTRHAALLVAQPHQIQRGADPLDNLSPRHTFHFEAKCNILCDRHVGKQRIILEHTAQLPRLGRTIDPALMIEPCRSAELNTALVRLFQPGQTSENGRFAGAGRTEENQNSRWVNRHCEPRINRQPARK